MYEEYIVENDIEIFEESEIIDNIVRIVSNKRIFTIAVDSSATPIQLRALGRRVNAKFGGVRTDFKNAHYGKQVLQIYAVFKNYDFGGSYDPIASFELPADESYAATLFTVSVQPRCDLGHQYKENTNEQL